MQSWFKLLCVHFSVSGRASFFYKPTEPNKTALTSGDEAKRELLELLKSEQVALIYHCHNHYCCPVGFEMEPTRRDEIFARNASNKEEIKNETDDKASFIEWILIADTSRKHAAMSCVKWSDIDRDLNCKDLEYLDIRCLHKGIQIKSGNAVINQKKPEINVHCILKFEKTPIAE
jgi:hypothetical protein